jgi:hypothetical protein
MIPIAVILVVRLVGGDASLAFFILPQLALHVADCLLVHVIFYFVHVLVELKAGDIAVQLLGGLVQVTKTNESILVHVKPSPPILHHYSALTVLRIEELHSLIYWVLCVLS